MTTPLDEKPFPNHRFDGAKEVPSRTSDRSTTPAPDGLAVVEIDATDREMIARGDRIGSRLVRQLLAHHDQAQSALAAVSKERDALAFEHRSMADFVRPRIPADQDPEQAESFLAWMGMIVRHEERGDKAVARAETAEAEVKRLTEDNEALRDGFRDKVALGASGDEILRFRDGYPNPAGGQKVFYRYTIEQARYRYADAVLAARQALSGSEKE